MKQEIFIPFPGFYESRLSDAIDSECAMMAYNACEDNDSLDEAAVQMLVMKHCDFRKAYLKAAQMYVKAFVIWIHDNTSPAVSLGFEFKELISPREYNFQTDRVLCTLDAGLVQFLRDTVSPMTLASYLEMNHKSRSGFHSFYSHNLADWPADVKDWDCNHCATLLQAWLADNVDDYEKWIDAIMEIMYEDWDDCLDAGMDWPAYEAGLTALTK